MKVNIVIPQSLISPTSMMGGIPIAHHLARRGGDVTLILLHHNLAAADEREIEIEPGVRAVYAGQMFVKKVGSRKIYFPFSKLLRVALSSSTGLLRQILKRRADINVIYKAQPPSLFAGIAAKALRRTPLVLMVDDLESESNNLKNPGFKTLFRAFERFGACASDAIIAHSSNLAEIFARLSGNRRKTVFIPPGVEPARYRYNETRAEALREKLDIEGRPVALYFGSIDRQSGHRVDMLIDSFAAVARRVPAAVLVLAGAGEVGAMEEYARKVGILDKVRFTGRFPLSDLPAYASLADVIVDPVDNSPANAAKCSSRVRLGMFFGKAVLTGDVGDSAWTLGDGGIAVRPDSPRAFEQALYLLLVDRRLRAKMGRKGKARVMQYFLWENVIDQYIEIFDSLLCRSGRKSRRKVPAVRLRRDKVSV